MTKFRWYHLALGLNFLASISIYLNFSYLAEAQLSSNLVTVIWLGGIFLTFVALMLLSLFHLAKAVRHLAKGEAAPLRKGMAFLKLASIPYFLLNFGYYFWFAEVALVITRGFALFTTLPILFSLVIAMTYLVMLGNSVYGICYVLLLRKQGRLTNGKALLHLIMHLVFVLDDASTIVLLIRHKEENKPTA